MKITKHMLKQLIKEELQNLTEAYPGQPTPEEACPEKWAESEENRRIFGDDITGMIIDHWHREPAIKEQVRQALEGRGTPGIVP